MSSNRALRREQILDAALVIVDRDGLDGLTMRKLCAEVGLSAPVVYRHFADKAAIVDGLVRRLVLEDGLGQRHEHSPREWLSKVFTAMHRQFTQHPGMVSLLGTSGPLLENGLELSDGVLHTLQAWGLDEPAVARTFQVLLAYTLGSVAMARGFQADDPHVVKEVMRYPRLSRMAPKLDARQPPVFDAGLAALLDALLPGAPQGQHGA